jgi:hypothetical protein
MMYQWEHSTDIRLRSAIKIAEALEISLDDLVSICYEK